jgi:hypothetical protein
MAKNEKTIHKITLDSAKKKMLDFIIVCRALLKCHSRVAA